MTIPLAKPTSALLVTPGAIFKSTIPPQDRIFRQSQPDILEWVGKVSASLLQLPPLRSLLRARLQGDLSSQPITQQEQKPCEFVANVQSLY